MKKILIALLFGILMLIIGTFGFVPIFNDVYVSLKSLEPGPDTETILLDLMVFVQWPLFFVAGVLIGLFVNKKYLTNKVRSCE